MKNPSPSTIALHSGHVPDKETRSRAVPIYQTSSYLFDSAEHAARLFGLKEFGNIYTRLMNPTTDVLEKRLAALEGGSGALATASGMAAIFLAISNIAQAGDHIVASASLYGGTETLFRHTLPRFGINTTFVEDLSPEKLAEAIRENTKLIYIETIGNPKGDVPDLAEIADTAHQAGIPLFVDNTFAPVLCRPFEHGADIIVYSCTKWIGGHGTTIGGAIIDGGKFDWANGKFPEFTEPDESYHGIIYHDNFGDIPGVGNIEFVLKARVQGMRNIGPCLSPHSAFLLLQGIETLPLRVKQHSANALALAEQLKGHPLVNWVNYTGLAEHPWHENAKKYLDGGFGSVFGFGIRGGADAAIKFIEKVEMASHLANVGDAKTLVIHPYSTTHQQLSEDAKLAAGINPEFIRVSVGIEDIDDIIADFNQALEKSQV